MLPRNRTPGTEIPKSRDTRSRISVTARATSSPSVVAVFPQRDQIGSQLDHDRRHDTDPVQRPLLPDACALYASAQQFDALRLAPVPGDLLRPLIPALRFLQVLDPPARLELFPRLSQVGAVDHLGWRQLHRLLVVADGLPVRGSLVGTVASCVLQRGEILVPALRVAIERKGKPDLVAGLVEVPHRTAGVASVPVIIRRVWASLARL